ncbi:class I SAM-dependent methyltransferase [Ruicaihuangia caeni]|uniref:Methyltransferase n=1 Tax=Ruicaihuangia caeni TaxID=3042517 RepID=A0AAW6TBS0_9MICO|nr:methyltransferase [Klugiella sp. YN-L-19]MDI2099733.1 methyltransferase [Klugiella sp. YN-L-19]
MVTEHYFSEMPASDAKLRQLRVRIAGREVEVTTASGVFSPERIDVGTQVLLANTPAPPPGGNLLDLGCGWGPIALTLATESPHATVWAVDVNERALDLVRRNAESLGLTNITAATPDQVPDDIRFMTVWSNPPIRVGKNELHAMLERWLPRLDHDTEAWLVVAKNLGADSLQRWLQGRFPDEFTFVRASTNKGFRVLRGRRR